MPKQWRHKDAPEMPPYHYTACGLDDIYLLSGYTVHETPHGKGISIQNLDELYEAIGRYLAEQRKALSGKELRFLRTQMDLSQEELGHLVGLSSRQVARWEKGLCEASGPTELLIRAFFLESVNGKLDLRALVESLAGQGDAPMREKSYFANNDGHWEGRRAA